MALLKQLGSTLAAILMITCGFPAHAADAASPYRIKAAFLLNFTHFVEWPANAFGAANDPLVIGIFGKDPFDGALEQMADGKTVDGRQIRVRIVSDADALRLCHLVFVPAAETRVYRRLADGLAGLSILTVGEVDGFAKRDGMINFVIDDGHVRFEVNPSAAAQVHLQVSSKLLQLAVVVGKPSR